MASAQVLPSSRKQEHLEAGKRRLEEFRKKKAADRAKKASTSSKVNASDISIDHKQPVESDNSRITNSDGAGTSAQADGPLEGSGGYVLNDNKVDSTKAIVKDLDFKTPSSDDYSTPVIVENHLNDFSTHDVPGFTGATPIGLENNEVKNNYGLYSDSGGDLQYGISADNSLPINTQTMQGFDSGNNKHSIFHGSSLQNSEEDSHNLNQSATMNTGFQSFTQPTTFGSYQQHMDSIQSKSDWRVSNLESKQDDFTSSHSNDLINSGFGGRNWSSIPGSFSSMHGGAAQSEMKGFDSDVRSSSNHGSMSPGTSQTSSRRPRPSFLDSLNVPRESSGTSFQSSEPEKNFLTSNTLSSNGTTSLGSSVFHRPSMEVSSVPDYSINFSVPSSNGGDSLKVNVNDNFFERKPDSYSSKQNEDFAALEQHIEDLTQEKFALQRALEASRALAESLAGENSSLTDNYNQQRAIVNQLKSDMASLQEEIKAHLVELESVKVEYANVQLECSAADERAKLLASEVIGLEEKALRLRSNELKLERQLEDAQAEMNSYRKKISSLEKDRQDMHSTIEALQEEKKLLQTKLRKASASGKSLDIAVNPVNRKETSTSTEDLDADTMSFSNQGRGSPGSVTESDTSGLPLFTENGQLNFDIASMCIPPEQMRMIQNINTIISELALEKEELMQALQSETSQCSKLKDLNKELSRKLEMQTQRLELLTAKSMANENGLVKIPEPQTMQDNAVYADEGDEVVERVLGWIMKLFPGGPGKRRTSKLH